MKLINYHSLAIVVAALVVALVVTMVVMPLVRRLAIRLGAIDMPGKAGTDSERHLHTQPTPRMGGLAIFLGFCISMARFVQLNSQLTTMLAGALIIAVLGMVDDVKNLPAWLKLIFQIVAAVVAVSGGSVIRYLSAPAWLAESGHLNLGIFSVPVTVLWVVLITISSMVWTVWLRASAPSPPCAFWWWLWAIPI